ncbi:hypothetical protein [Nocardioides sp. TF02-7]|uniref:hypothetical protein n=1 Tax=Nocardioides sp. TF02-7 TaxID=2917724 RepID=UPI001F0573E9|nr:hypothetical protein [Nocardioides sp. TF02-7]UMG91821.1 hypothetical protein MF408_17475 [Nocardioides sp. TF02-7]
MEILLWLVPAAVVTLTTMLWVAWWGREGRGAVDRETAARRLGEALTKQRRRRPGYAVARRAPDRSTGVALRPSRVRPAPVPPLTDRPDRPGGPDGARDTGGPRGDRRAS